METRCFFSIKRLGTRRLYLFCDALAKAQRSEKLFTNPSYDRETKIKSHVIFLIKQTNVWIICKIIYKAILSYKMLIKGSEKNRVAVIIRFDLFLKLKTSSWLFLRLLSPLTISHYYYEKWQEDEGFGNPENILLLRYKTVPS